MDVRLRWVALVVGLAGCVAPVGTAESDKLLGESVSEDKYAFLVGVAVRGHEPHCQGSLIQDNMVLTAAHCVARAAWDLSPGRSELQVVVGTEAYGVDALRVPSELTDALAGEGCLLARRLDVGRDIAVLRLERSIPDAVTVSVNTQLRPVHTTQVNAVSGGPVRIDSNPSGGSAQARSTVFEASPRIQVFRNPDDTIRVLFRGGEAVCQGDSGSPLLDENGALIGVLSLGDCNGEGAYTSVHTESSWLYGSWLSWRGAIDELNESEALAFGTSAKCLDPAQLPVLPRSTFFTRHRQPGTALPVEVGVEVALQTPAIPGETYVYAESASIALSFALLTQCKGTLARAEDVQLIARDVTSNAEMLRIGMMESRLAEQDYAVLNDQGELLDASGNLTRIRATRAEYVGWVEEAIPGNVRWSMVLSGLRRDSYPTEAQCFRSLTSPLSIFDLQLESSLRRVQ